jgi:hypothetical protein
MYTSIPQKALASAVEVAIREVFEWHSAKTNTAMQDLKVKVTYPRPGHAAATFANKGYSLQEVIRLLDAVCTEVYFQQSEQAPILRQRQGLPMGGKASAELANLYCYVKEAQFIDSLIEKGNIQEAKTWYNTWRYIDDLLGFGDRGNAWKDIQYGMEHTETTDIKFSSRDGRSQAVFLGMRINSKPEGIFTSVQPKGEGWTWLPRKFIDYSSCHTHYTKWYMLKGLLIRSLTICNNQSDFFRAAIHYTQGLISRGFPFKSLWRSWSKFCHEKINHPAARRNLISQFRDWIDKQDFSACQLDEDAQCRQKVASTTTYYKKSLMCGFYAMNHILSALRLPMVTENELDDQAREMADRESNILYCMDPTIVLDNAMDPRGNYAADTLIHLLRCKSAAAVERWRTGQPISTCTILLGTGDHWQAVLMDKEKQWFVLERYTKYPIQNLVRFLTAKMTNGAVYEVGMFETLPNPTYLDTIVAPQSSKVLTTRSRQELQTYGPPRKRQNTSSVKSFVAHFATNLDEDNVPFAVDFQGAVTTRKESRTGSEVQSTLPGLVLPSEFQEDPRFQFEGPVLEGVDYQPMQDENMADNGIDALIGAMSPHTYPSEGHRGCRKKERPPRRSTRVRLQPLLYQSDEVERKEKEKNAKH